MIAVRINTNCVDNMHTCKSTYEPTVWKMLKIVNETESKHTILCSSCLVSRVASYILIYTKCQRMRSLDTEMREVRPQTADVHMWILTMDH